MPQHRNPPPQVNSQCVGFGAKLTPTTHKKYGEIVSSYCQDGQNPTKNPKPSVHFVISLEL